jgi:hypothetical protein
MSALGQLTTDIVEYDRQAYCRLQPSSRIDMSQLMSALGQLTCVI